MDISGVDQGVLHSPSRDGQESGRVRGTDVGEKRQDSDVWTRGERARRGGAPGSTWSVALAFTAVLSVGQAVTGVLSVAQAVTGVLSAAQAVTGVLLLPF